ncbi:hypothetical protein CK203_021489 [Vitis vinifera]|uniref:Ubiquitin thioesterase OTU n=1 Tax=Vitis vinifera TaxID=29760 RepID=A0A438IS42_VITVI|nr:hypothetical protein CK203_078341 [Vitis vinifera]RVW99532.1 hypothetical protein CK203_021489 [Vitis vinifera]
MCQKSHVSRKSPKPPKDMINIPSALLAAIVQSDATKYSEAFLEKPNEEYCAWILNPEKWGGGSEFLPLS